MAMKLALGPISYFWPAPVVRAFYTSASEWPVDVVYLGETVCSKRRALRLQDWLEIADQLAAAGKEVVLSTLTLIEAESELATLKRIVMNGRYTVEANDMAAVQLLSGRAPFVAGPHINIYNPETLALLADSGARRWVMPVELSRDTLTIMQSQRPGGMETEVFAFGRLPLAFSARCFTARAHNRGKDDCGFVCGDYPDGMLLRTRESASFLNLNGIQVQSAGTCNLIGEVPDLRARSVDVLRLSPQPHGMAEVVALFRQALAGDLPTTGADERAAAMAPGESCNGYWYGAPGMVWRP